MYTDSLLDELLDNGPGSSSSITNAEFEEIEKGFSNSAADAAALAAPYTFDKSSTPIADGGKVQRINFNCWDDILLLKAVSHAAPWEHERGVMEVWNSFAEQLQKPQASGCRKKETVVNQDSKDCTVYSKKRK